MRSPRLAETPAIRRRTQHLERRTADGVPFIIDERPDAFNPRSTVKIVMSVAALANRVTPLFAGDGLKAKALRGSAWTFGGYGAQQVLRLGSNLILTRLLFPEAFGLMALVQVFMQGLAMFSDVGIGPAIIQSKRGDDPDFLNTAWTIQVIRGFVLWLAACGLAWPVARFYGEPLLAQMLPVAGLSAVIAGFNSTKLITANRHLALGRLTAIELISQAISILCLIGLAWSMRSVWALVIGTLIGTATKTVLAHAALPGAANRLHWDRTSHRQLLGFGKYIFLSTVAGFMVNQGDRAILGYFLSAAEIGVYSIAVMLAMVPLEITRSLCQKVVFPLYAKRDAACDPAVRDRIFHMRSAVTALGLTAYLPMILAGPWIISVLYDSRYQNAGSFLVLLSTAFALKLITTSAIIALLARGDSKRFLQLLLVLAIMNLSGMSAGILFLGAIGAPIGIVAAELVSYPFVVVAVRHYGLFMPRHDITAIAVVMALCMLSVAINDFSFLA